MPYAPLDPQQTPGGSARRDADPDQLRSLYVPPSAREQYHLAAVAALKADPEFKGVLERVRNAGAKQIAEWGILAEASRIAAVIGDTLFAEGAIKMSISTRLTLERLKNIAGNFQHENGVHQVRIILEEFVAEPVVWTDPVVAVGQFVLMLADDYGYWLRLLEEAGCGSG